MMLVAQICILVACAAVVSGDTHLNDQVLGELRSFISETRQDGDMQELPGLTDVSSRRPETREDGDVPELPDVFSRSTETREDGDVPELPDVFSRSTDVVNVVSMQDRIARKMFLSVHDRTRSDYKINMCYYCDKDCEDYLNGEEAAKAFFASTTAKVQTKLSTLDSWSFELQSIFVLMPHVSLNFLRFKDRGSHGSARLASINTNFWNARLRSGETLYAKSVSVGCDVDMLAISPESRVWNSVNVAGIAPMYKICIESSYATLKLKKPDESFSVLVAHELGHLLGMWHDGAPEPSLRGSVVTKVSSFAGIWADIQENCQGGNDHCADGRDRCIMSEVVNSQTKFSGCSQAYFSLFVKLAEKFGPTYYSDVCMHDRKREVTFDELERQEDLAPFQDPPTITKKQVMDYLKKIL